MKAYLYHSRNKVSKINNNGLVKRQIASLLVEKLNLLEIKEEDVSIDCVSISNDIDVFLILSFGVSMSPETLAKRMDEIKTSIGQIIQKDQGKQIDLKIKTKIDPKYNGVVPSSKKEKEEMNNDSGGEVSELDYEQRSKMYVPVEPAYSFDRVILPKEVIEKIEHALNILKYEKKVFDDWGLYEIQPRPSSSLSFYGPSGTGKTMAAEAVAQKLGKKILKVSYADVESKYHGEGPKMVKAIFLAAEKGDAVLFFDEADSLLSKRLTNVSQGSEQAINSMRSQLLICLEEFRGIVIFATNLVINYDSAFLTRLISVEFKKPDIETRKKIWDVHIKPVNDGFHHKLNIPLSQDVNTQELAEKFDFAGREIRNAVISACIAAAMEERDIVTQTDFIKAAQKIVDEIKGIANAKDYTDDKKKEMLKQVVVNRIKEGGIQSVSTDNE